MSRWPSPHSERAPHFSLDTGVGPQLLPFRRGKSEANGSLPSPKGRGCIAIPIHAIGTRGRAFARRPVVRRRLRACRPKRSRRQAAGRRVMDAQGAQVATARLPSPRLRDARRRVRGRLHGEKGPDGRTKPSNPSLGLPAAAGSPPSPQGRGLRFWLRSSCFQRKIWVEISSQVASPLVLQLGNLRVPSTSKCLGYNCTD
jgi:hypothetical protein